MPPTRMPTSRFSPRGRPHPAIKTGCRWRCSRRWDLASRSSRPTFPGLNEAVVDGESGVLVPRRRRRPRHRYRRARRGPGSSVGHLARPQRRGQTTIRCRPSARGTARYCARSSLTSEPRIPARTFRPSCGVYESCDRDRLLVPGVTTRRDVNAGASAAQERGMTQHAASPGVRCQRYSRPRSLSICLRSRLVGRPAPGSRSPPAARPPRRARCRRRRVVKKRSRCLVGSHALRPGLRDLEHAIEPTLTHRHPVPHVHGRGGLGVFAVDAHVTRSARGRRLGAALVDAHRPEPRVNAGRGHD